MAAILSGYCGGYPTQMQQGIVTLADRARKELNGVGMAPVETATVNSVLTVRNPSGNAAAITITPVAGGPRSVSTHLIITRLQ